MVFEWIKFGVVATLFLSGIVVLYIALFGMFRFQHALTRIHSAAMADTLVLLLFVIAAVLAEGFNFTSLKLALVLCVQWCTSPLASHMLTKFEFITDPKLKEYCKFEIDEPEENKGEEI